MTVTTGQKLSRFASHLDDEGDNLPFTVDTLAELPAAADNSGQVRYVEGVGHFKSDGADWNPLENPLTLEMFADNVGTGDASVDTAAMQAMAALPSLKTIRFTGLNIVPNDEVIFPQDNLTVIVDDDFLVTQADNTQTIDTLVEFSGDKVGIMNWVTDGNVANNSSYTGRGELLKLSGDYAYLGRFTGTSTHDIAFSTALYTTGRYGSFNNLTTFDTGKNAIRDQGDFNEFRNLQMFEYGEHGFVKDSGYGGAASTYTLVSGWRAITSKAESTEAVLFDHDGVKGKLCRVENGYISAPNMTGPDSFKFAYMSGIEVHNVRSEHASVPGTNVSLRFQQDVDHVSLSDVVLDGGINFDATVACTMKIGGKSRIGVTHETVTAIDDFRGTLTIEDGVELHNATQQFIATDSSTFDNKIILGKLILSAQSGTPNIVTHRGLQNGGTPRRAVAGDTVIKEPISVTGTVKTRATDGRWVLTNDNRESSVSQAGERVFYVSNTDFPSPRDTEGWVRGDLLRKRSPSASSDIEVVCVTAGASTQNAWASSTVYSVGDWVYNGANVYACTVGGTSAGSGGPAGTGTGITDGGVTWDYVDALAVFKISKSAAA